MLDNLFKESKDDWINIESIYNRISDGSISDMKAILELRDWFISIYISDKRDGSGIPQSLTKLSNKAVNYNLSNILKDRLWRINNHSSEPIGLLLKNLKTKVQREHKLLPIYAVREVDSKSIQWLSKKTGRNIREKLANKPYLKAVNRKMSTNTTENRLLKDYLIKLEKYLQLRVDTFSIDIDNKLHTNVKRWLNSEASKEILPWDNLSPNNTLLQDKNYRKIWDAWLWLQRLDEDLQRDYKHLLVDWNTILFWTLVSQFRNIEGVRIVEQPIIMDYDDFTIKPTKTVMGIIYSPTSSKHLSQLSFVKKSKTIEISIGKHHIEIKTNYDKENKKYTTTLDSKTIDYSLEVNSMEKLSKEVVAELLKGVLKIDVKKDNDVFAQLNTDVVIDIASVQPLIISNGEIRSLPYRLLYQIWKNEKNEKITIDAGVSDAVTLSSQSNIVSIYDILSQTSNINENDKNIIMLKIVEKLKQQFCNDKLFSYIVPDIINDFSLKNVRKSINFHFNNAQPLPKSIASIFTWLSLNDSKNIKENNCILVIDGSLNELSATPIVFKKELSGELKKHAPESNGHYLERYPSISLKKNMLNNEITNINDTNNDLSSFSGEDLLIIKDNISFFKDNNWEAYNNIELINQKFHWKKLKEKVEKITTGSIQILLVGEIAKSLEIDYERVDKLDESPLIGAELLNISQNKVKDVSLWVDHLPELTIETHKNGNFHLLTLVKDQVIRPLWGEKQRINIDEKFILPKGVDSFSFPIFIGGDDGEPINYKAFITSKYLPLKHDTEVSLDLSYIYGGEDTYNLQFQPLKSLNTFNHLDVVWKLDESLEIEVNNPIYPRKQTWNELRKYYNPLKPEKGETDLVEWLSDGIHRFTENNRFGEPMINALLNLLNNNNENGIKKFSINLGRFFEVTTRNLWSQGRSISDADFPTELSDKIDTFIKLLLDLSGIKIDQISIEKHQEIPELKSVRLTALMLLIRFHKDTPNIVILYLQELLSLSLINNKNKFLTSKLLDFSSLVLGGLETIYQQSIFELLINNFTKGKDKLKLQILSVFSIATWRHSEFMVYFHQNVDMKLILNFIFHNLFGLLEDIKQGKINKTLLFHIQNSFELLLSILRIRTNNKFLNPNDSKTKKIAYLVRRIDSELHKNKQQLRCRIQFDLNDKPKSLVKMSDLSYSLNMYLTGDIGANSISISRIVDSEDM